MGFIMKDEARCIELEKEYSLSTNGVDAAEVWSSCRVAGLRERLILAKGWTAGIKNYKEADTEVSKRRDKQSNPRSVRRSGRVNEEQ